MVFKILPAAVLRQYLIVVVANFNMFTLGMEVAWVSPVLVKLRDANQTVLSQPITEEHAAWIVSLTAVSGFFTTFSISYLMDRLGRKWCFLLTATRVLLALFCIFATEVWMLFVIRMLSGISSTITLAVVPAYASEIASREQRGALGALSQISCSIGMLIMLTTGPFVSYVTLNIVQFSLVLLTVIPQLFLPESPYFLYVQGRKEDSLKLLTLLRCSEEIAKREINEISKELNETNISKKELLKDVIFLKTVGKCMFLSIGCQMVGYNAVTGYLQTILESTKVDVSPEVSSVVIGVIQLFGCFCTIFLTDRFGRKPILSVTLAGMAIGWVGLGVFFKLSETNFEIHGCLNYLPLVSLTLIIIGFNAGLGSILWMLIAELFDGPSRAFGIQASIFVTTIFIFITMKFFTTVIIAIGSAATYWFLCVNCVILCLFIIFCVPETKGKSILEIQRALGRKLLPS